MDIAELREFYAGPLGKATRPLLAAQLQPRCGAKVGFTIMGLGYAAPYLEGLDMQGAHLLAFMMARQGVVQWPDHGGVSSALVDEYDLPLLESSVDVALLVHALEAADNPLDLLQEVWRVLSPQGKLVLAVPNRRSLWAGFESSPFGHGQPYSRSQLARLLREAQFTAQSWSYALLMPPSRRRWLQNAAPVVERAGDWLGLRFGGVLIVEAVKQVYAFTPGKRLRRLVPRLNPILLPRPATIGRGLGRDEFSSSQ